MEWLAGEKVTCADDKKNEHSRNHLNTPERMTCAKTHLTCVDCESCDPLPLHCPSAATGTSGEMPWPGYFLQEHSNLVRRDGLWNFFFLPVHVIILITCRS